MSELGQIYHSDLWALRDLEGTRDRTLEQLGICQNRRRLREAVGVAKQFAVFRDARAVAVLAPPFPYRGLP